MLSCKSLGADHLTLEGGGGGWFWKKSSCKRLSEENNCMQHKCNRKRMGKKGKNILPARLLEKQILDDQKSPAPPQELNGRPLTRHYFAAVYST